VIPTGDPTISRPQCQRTVVQYRRFGPTPHPRGVRVTQAQFEVGRTVRRQADYKPGVLSTTIPRGPRRPKFLERTEPSQVLPIRRHAVIAILRASRCFSFRFNLEATCHRIRNVNFLLKFGGYSQVQVLYKLTACYEHDSRCDDDRIFPNRLDPLDRTQSNLFDRLT
jgi:hypothetical protein